MKFTQFIVFLAFVVSAASAGGSWFLYQRLEVEQALREEAESDKVQLEERAVTLEAQIDQYKKEAGRLQEQMKGYVSQRDNLQKELDQVRKETADLRNRIRELETAQESLTEQVQQEEAMEQSVTMETKKLPAASTPTAQAVAPAEEKKPSKKEEKSKSPTGTDPRPDQVLSVNRKFNYVVVNVGLRDQLKVGDLLRVEQGGKLVGRVQVDRLYENFSACLIVEEIKPAQIQEGDLVRIA